MLSLSALVGGQLRLATDAVPNQGHFAPCLWSPKACASNTLHLERALNDTHLAVVDGGPAAATIDVVAPGRIVTPRVMCATAGAHDDVVLASGPHRRASRETCQRLRRRVARPEP